jgi:hypothetical protein
MSTFGDDVGHSSDSRSIDVSEIPTGGSCEVAQVFLALLGAARQLLPAAFALSRIHQECSGGTGCGSKEKGLDGSCDLHSEDIPDAALSQTNSWLTR